MQVTKCGPVSIRRVEGGPNVMDPAGPGWPDILVCKVDVDSIDDVTPTGEFPETQTFVVRIPFTADDAAATLEQHERRAMRLLAQELRVIADALEANAG